MPRGRRKRSRAALTQGCYGRARPGNGRQSLSDSSLFERASWQQLAFFVTLGPVPFTNRLLWPVFALCAIALPNRLHAHGDLHLQIMQVTEQLAKDPRNAELYLKRGELHRSHQAWDEAQADYDRAISLDPGLTVIDFTRGRMFLEAGWLNSAKVSLDRFLRQHTNHVE